jgi:hypothetical protein
MEIKRRSPDKGTRGTIEGSLGRNIDKTKGHAEKKGVLYGLSKETWGFPSSPQSTARGIFEVSGHSGDPWGRGGWKADDFCRAPRGGVTQWVFRIFFYQACGQHIEIMVNGLGYFFYLEQHTLRSRYPKKSGHVILPLQGAGCSRCSVKPASRGPPLSKVHDTCWRKPPNPALRRGAMH